MTDRLAHRGPDDEGIWISDGGCVGFGHRRLSILDLSSEGSQPMASPSGRYVVVYNGEVYNHMKLRRELRCTSWRGTSDTETILSGFDRWGVESTIQKMNGMFAIAVWDTREQELTLVRDRVGIKPLYYAFSDKGLLFASELSSIEACGSFSAAINGSSLALYLRYSAIPAPHTIYDNAFKVLPGMVIKFREPNRSSLQQQRYWSATEVASKGQQQMYSGSPDEALEELNSVLIDAVGDRMISDVPLGAFLSGGIDSSLVVGLMQSLSGQPVRTFTLGTSDAAFDESSYARAVAEHLGTQHTELLVDESTVIDAVKIIGSLSDEPFADPAQIANYLVSRLARQHVTVALSGDGGDELFAGYNRHSWGPRVWTCVKRLPKPLRTAVARGLTSLSPETWNRLFDTTDGVLPPRLRHRIPGYKLHKIAGLLSTNSRDEFYQVLLSQWTDPDSLVIQGDEPKESPLSSEIGDFDFTSAMMLLDFLGYLPNDILTKVDRCTMAVGLEGRVPLLDHRVVEYAWRLPLSMKMRGGTGKWILRELLYRYVPRELVDRPKTGFGVPLATWLRGPLREWAEDLINESRLRKEGYLNPQPIRTAWAQFLSGKGAHEYQIWTVLMFQSWLAHHARLSRLTPLSSKSTFQHV